MNEDYVTMLERQRAESLDMIQRLAAAWHDSEAADGEFQHCPAVQCLEAAQFLVRMRSEILREDDRDLWHADLDTCQERVKEASRV